MQKNYDFVADIIRATKEEVGAFIQIDHIPEAEQARGVIYKYTKVFEGNFITWMASAALTARSPYARYAASENLWVELRDNHPGMLHAFAESCGALTPGMTVGVPELKKVRHLVGELSGLKSVALMTLLESTSEVFIPYLVLLAKRLSCGNFEYANIHGTADVAHAEQFAKALREEVDQAYINPIAEIEQAAQVTIALLKDVFILPN